MSKDVPIASLLRVERGVAAPEELAAIAVVVACYAHRPADGRDAAAGSGPGRRRAALSAAGCWA
ncbi:acyl-CoA carboxylase epsilon subunit, partial [Streptomyces sp. NPDC054932]